MTPRNSILMDNERFQVAIVHADYPRARFDRIRELMLISYLDDRFEPDALDATATSSASNVGSSARAISSAAEAPSSSGFVQLNR